MGTDHREGLQVETPCLTMLALVNSSHEHLNLSQECQINIHTDHITYLGIRMNDQSLTNNTKETCLTGPPEQIIGKVQYTENEKMCNRLTKRETVPSDTNFTCPKGTYT